MYLLDRFELTKEVFETKVIGIGANKRAICTIFRKTEKEMDEWCMKEYGMNFKTTYEILKQLTYAEWKECLRVLGEKGNPTAMSIMQEKLASDVDEDASSIVFNVNVKMEGDDDKYCG